MVIVISDSDLFSAEILILLLNQFHAADLWFWFQTNLYICDLTKHW